MKTEFSIENIYGNVTAEIGIFTPGDKTRKPYLRITSTRGTLLMSKDLELFAVNILKALKSKKLKS